MCSKNIFTQSVNYLLFYYSYQRASCKLICFEIRYALVIKKILEPVSIIETGPIFLLGDINYLQK